MKHWLLHCLTEVEGNCNMILETEMRGSFFLICEYGREGGQKNFSYLGNAIPNVGNNKLAVVFKLPASKSSP